jgi:hypothetical protein
MEMMDCAVGAAGATLKGEREAAIEAEDGRWRHSSALLWRDEGVATPVVGAGQMEMRTGSRQSTAAGMHDSARASMGSGRVSRVSVSTAAERGREFEGKAGANRSSEQSSTWATGRVSLESRGQHTRHQHEGMQGRPRAATESRATRPSWIHPGVATSFIQHHRSLVEKQDSKGKAVGGQSTQASPRGPRMQHAGGEMRPQSVVMSSAKTGQGEGVPSMVGRTSHRKGILQTIEECPFSGKERAREAVVTYLFSQKLTKSASFTTSPSEGV